ncbi:microfibrillar-associated protein 2 isoform X3 [Denticeps clupeoides]|uniref:Microfibrillar-associated protein 2 n=1 Tax=Denticeps clupeoides TaxID=299321 RepID=A0AAY4B2U3_9TELE|nr:microfibrillar-associated protein 2 isoform X3 [Denticeps clupeoides]
MRVSCLLLLTLPVLIIAQQYPQQFFPVQEEYDYDITDVELQDKNLRKLTTGPGEFEEFKTEPTEPGPLDCREEQYPCTRLYSVHQPCKQCLNSLCFYSLRRVYVINKEVCVRTVCAHEELLRADLCRDQFSRCGVAALSGQCASMGGSCGKSCGGC